MTNRTTVSSTALVPSLEAAWQDVGSSFERFCLSAGIEAIEQILCEDAQRLTGERHSRGVERSGQRWGTTAGKIGFHGGKVSVRLPDGDLPAITGDGTSKSAASRRFVALSTERLAEWMASDLSKLDLLVIQIDGLHIGNDLVLVAALGIEAKAKNIRSAWSRAPPKMPRWRRRLSIISSSAGSTPRCPACSSSTAPRR